MKKTTVVKSIEVLDYSNDPHIDKRTKDFLSKLNSGGTSVEKLSIPEARNVLVNIQNSVNVDVSGINVNEVTITSAGHTIKLHVVHPKNDTGVIPAFLFIHGGGWVLGDFPTHKRMIRDLVVLSGCAAVFVNYTPTPDAKFPTALNEIFAVAKWVSEYGREINVDGKNLAVVGNSVGGNMSTVLALMANEKGGPNLKLQILMWPVTDTNFETESYRRYGEQRFLTSSLMQWMFDLYANPEDRDQIYISPLRASNEQLRGLPPTLIQVAENDILRDEGEAYGRKLDSAGVPVTTVRYNGMIHDFGLLNPLAELPTTRSLFVHAAAELQKYLR